MYFSALFLNFFTKFPETRRSLYCQVKKGHKTKTSFSLPFFALKFRDLNTRHHQSSWVNPIEEKLSKKVNFVLNSFIVKITVFLHHECQREDIQWNLYTMMPFSDLSSRKAWVIQYKYITRKKYFSLSPNLLLNTSSVSMAWALVNFSGLWENILTLWQSCFINLA